MFPRKLLSLWSLKWYVQTPFQLQVKHKGNLGCVFFSKNFFYIYGKWYGTFNHNFQHKSNTYVTYFDFFLRKDIFHGMGKEMVLSNTVSNTKETNFKHGHDFTFPKNIFSEMVNGMVYWNTPWITYQIQRGQVFDTTITLRSSPPQPPNQSNFWHRFFLIW